MRQEIEDKIGALEAQKQQIEPTWLPRAEAADDAGHRSGRVPFHDG